MKRKKQEEQPQPSQENNQKEAKTGEENKPEQPQKEQKERDEKKELIETLQRLQAEFENYKKRVDRDYENMVKCSNEDLIKQILPIIDNFELALKSCKVKDEFYKGMELIYSQLIDTLLSRGVKPIECLGKKFDPYYHEALLTEESEKEPNTILEELQKGYMLYDKVIRHSKVKIAKKKKEDKKEEDEISANK